PYPKAKIDGTGRQTHSHLAFAQGAFTDAQLARGLRGAQDVIAELETHRHNHAEKRKADQVRHLNPPDVNQGRHAGGKKGEERNTTPYERRPPATFRAA